jgi:hypothetical protein
MEKEGWAISSKDAKRRWVERFRKAGLPHLPQDLAALGKP